MKNLTSIEKNTVSGSFCDYSRTSNTNELITCSEKTTTDSNKAIVLLNKVNTCLAVGGLVFVVGSLLFNTIINNIDLVNMDLVNAPVVALDSP